MEMLIKTCENGNDDMCKENLHNLCKTTAQDALIKNKLIKIMSPNANEVHSEEEDNYLEEEKSILECDKDVLQTDED